jgi:hypothetical protein
VKPWPLESNSEWLVVGTPTVSGKDFSAEGAGKLEVSDGTLRKITALRDKIGSAVRLQTTGLSLNLEDLLQFSARNSFGVLTRLGSSEEHPDFSCIWLIALGRSVTLSAFGRKNLGER